VGRGPDHLRVDNIELGDNNGRLAQDTQEPSSPILLIYNFINIQSTDHNFRYYALFANDCG
jgi:hypothetical protein